MSHKAETQIVIADDHPIFMGGLASLIQSDPQYVLAATCSDGPSALQAIRTLKPDVALLDIGMPGQSGLSVLKQLTNEASPARVVLLTASATDGEIVTAVEDGAWGILLKEMAADELLTCLKAVIAGERWLPQHLVEPALNREAARQSPNKAVAEPLTTREEELVQLAAEGLSNKQIAHRLGVMEGTVKIHLHNIYQKLGVANRTALAAFTRDQQKVRR